ncbi:MAG: type IVB secretion system protein IcmH/DotU, partial [Tateyamaria sp.]
QEMRPRVVPDDERTVLSLRSDHRGIEDARKLSLAAAREGVGREIGLPSNPVMAASSELLGFLGLLRTGHVDMPQGPLRDHLHVALSDVQTRAAHLQIPEDQVKHALYALCATADDIASTVPGSDPEAWSKSGLTAEFFGDPNARVGVFTRIHRLSQHPNQNADVLELMLACLSLGLEGQYRTAPDRVAALALLRNELHEALIRARPAKRTNLSPYWTPVVLAGTRKFVRMPLWMIAGVAAAMVVVLYGVLAWILTQAAQAAQAQILDLPDPDTPLAIERVAPPDRPTDPDAEVVVYEAPETGQTDRVRAQLAPEIDAGLTTVAEEGDYIAVRLGSALEFGAGAAELATESPIIARIAAILDQEPGDIIVEGHSDNIPLSGRGRYKTNEALSEARAAAVRDVLARYMRDPSRIRVVGVGAAKPLDRANTAAARARNRRVDILLRKEARL